MSNSKRLFKASKIAPVMHDDSSDSRKRELCATSSGVTAAAAADILWTLTSYDVHRRLVVERKWSADTPVLTLLRSE